MPNCTLSVSPWTMSTLSSRDAEPLRDELREGRLVALAVAVRAGQHLDRADRIDADLRRFPQADARAERADRRRGRDAAGLDVVEKPMPRSLPAWRSLACAGEALVVGDLQRLVERGVVVAGVVVHDDRRLVREGVMKLRRRISPGPSRARAPPSRPGARARRWPPAARRRDRRRRARCWCRPHRPRVDRRDVVLARQQRRVEIGRHARRRRSTGRRPCWRWCHAQPRILPSRRAPVRVVTWSRPWASDRKLSVRSRSTSPAAPTFFGPQADTSPRHR
jgi:hypothetical protein